MPSCSWLLVQCTKEYLTQYFIILQVTKLMLIIYQENNIYMKSKKDKTHIGHWLCDFYFIDVAKQKTNKSIFFFFRIQSIACTTH